MSIVAALMTIMAGPAEAQTPIAGINGTSCDYPTVEAAIDAAPAGTTVFVAPGTYPAQSDVLNYNIAKDLNVVQATALCGHEPAPVADAVVLTRASTATDDAVLEVTGVGTEVRVRNITIEGSTGVEGNVQVFTGSTLTLDSSKVSDASTSGDGGGLRVLSGATLIGSGTFQITDNATEGDGGGIYVDNGVVILDGTGTVAGNAAENGGGIHAVNNATVKVKNGAIVANNTALVGGGGASINGTTSLRVSEGGAVSGNAALMGGGVRLDGVGSALTLANNGTVTDNDAGEFGGGGIHGSVGSSIQLLPGTAVSDNQSASIGGGIVSFGSVTAGGKGSPAPVEISGNIAATEGGGLYIASGASASLNTTRLNTNAAASGGGLFLAGLANIFENSPCDPTTLTFEEYCSEIRDNTASLSGAAVLVRESGQLTLQQVGVIGNESPLGVVRMEDNSVTRIWSTMVLNNTVPTAHGIFTSNGHADVVVKGATFAHNSNRAMDTDASTAKWVVSRTFSDSGTWYLGPLTTGACNQQSKGTAGRLPGGHSFADPRFETNEHTAFMPSPRGPLADKCEQTGGSGYDAVGYPVKDADGVASSTEYDIGAIEADRQPLLTPGGLAAYEGDAETTTFSIPVTLEYPLAEIVTADWATIDTNTTPNATVGVDYQAASGTVTFLPGETEQFIDILIYGDTENEPGTYLGEWLAIQFKNLSQSVEHDREFLFGLGLIIIGNDD